MPLSAGIGVTPVLAMLHALAANRSTRQIIWLHSARDRHRHPFASEASSLVGKLPNARAHVCYTRPGTDDKMGEHFDFAGRLSRSVFDEIAIPRDSDDGHKFESLEIIVDKEQELIVELTIALRPYPALKLFRDAIYTALKDKLPPNVWD